MIILRLFMGLLVAWLLGYLIIYLFDREKKMPLIEGAALSYLIGQGAITLLWFLLFLLPIVNRSAIATLLVVVLFAWKSLVDRKKRWTNPIKVIAGLKLSLRDKKNMILILLLVVLASSLAVKISYSFINACSKPEYAWDASGNWTAAGQNIYYTEKYRPDKLLNAMKESTNPSYPSNYPKAIPLMHYWLFWWMGEANDQWSKIIFPIELICLLIIFYYGLKPIRGPLGAFAFVYFLCSAPLFLYHSTIGYADLTKTVYFAAGMIYFYHWLQTKQGHYFWFFSLFMAFTTWIKLEGEILYAIGLVLLLIYLWRGWQGTLKSKLYCIGSYLLLFVIIGLPWQLFTMFNRVSNPQGALQPIFSEFFVFHGKIYGLMFMDGSWGLFWVMAAAALLLFFRRQMTGNNLYLFMAILIFYGSLLFIYLGSYGTMMSLIDTFNRLLFPIYPVAVFNLGCVIPALRITQEFNI